MLFKNKKEKKNDLLQDFDVREQLGKGGFATVYHARCHKTGRDVAVKKVSFGMSSHLVYSALTTKGAVMEIKTPS